MRSRSQTERLHAAIGHVVGNSLFNPYCFCKLPGLMHALMSPRTRGLEILHQPNDFLFFLVFLLFALSNLRRVPCTYCRPY